jgi:hypothetical protein
MFTCFLLIYNDKGGGEKRESFMVDIKKKESYGNSLREAVPHASPYANTISMYSLFWIKLQNQHIPVFWSRIKLYSKKCYIIILLHGV